MPQIDLTPKGLKPYTQYGLDVYCPPGSTEGIANCIYCDSEGKAYINGETGLYNCKVCGESLNPVGWLRHVYKISSESTCNYAELAAERKLLHEDTLLHWGLECNVYTGNWLLPGYSNLDADSELVQLYRLQKVPGQGSKMFSAATLNHTLVGLHRDLFDQSKHVVYVCEGWGDALVLWETLRITRKDDTGKLIYTANPLDTLLADANVVAVPGATTFLDHWGKWFDGKTVIICMDNDYPKAKAPPAGYAGVKRVVKVLTSGKALPYRIGYLRWGPEGYTTDKPNGYDVKDWLTRSNSPPDRVRALAELFEALEDVPKDLLVRATGHTRTADRTDATKNMAYQLCTNFADLKAAWQDYMKWHTGLDRFLVGMYAAVISTKSIGDQLWLKGISPASTGKTTIAEGLAVNQDYVVSYSTIRGLHSGWKQPPPKKGEERKAPKYHTLLEECDGKTLIIKDADTLLQLPNLTQVLSEFRDVYDGKSRSTYRNQEGVKCEVHRMTCIWLGTNALTKIDQSELGERFLDIIILDSIDDDMEDTILLTKALQAAEEVQQQSDGTVANQYNPKLRHAMQLSAGYVEYVRENADKLLKAIDIHHPTNQEAGRQCARLGKLTAYLRARPVDVGRSHAKRDEKSDREMAARLTAQLVRAAYCHAAVLNKTMLDDEVMYYVKYLALDTARGRTMQICHMLYKAMQTTEGGCYNGHIANELGATEEQSQHYMRFLRRIQAVQSFVHVNPKTRRKSLTKWRMTPPLLKLYEEILL